MLLNEIFDSNTKNLKYKKYGPIDSYFFDVGDSTIEMKTYNVGDFRTQAGVNIDGSGIGFDFNTDGSEEMTNKGDAFKILPTVINHIQSEVKKLNPDYIGFGAQEKSRQKLYDRIVNRLLKKFPNYKLVENPDVMFDLNGAKYYLIKKV